MTPKTRAVSEKNKAIMAKLDPAEAFCGAFEKGSSLADALLQERKVELLV